jgi:hypothetical protein
MDKDMAIEMDTDTGTKMEIDIKRFRYWITVKCLTQYPTSCSV